MFQVSLPRSQKSATELVHLCTPRVLHYLVIYAEIQTRILIIYFFKKQITGNKQFKRVTR